VITRLLKSGYTVYAPPNPLRGLASDAATIATFVKSIAGPVILVGHSYGGAVISVAARSDSNVKALVYVDAFAPDEGESQLSLLSSYPPPPKDFFTAIPFTSQRPRRLSRPEILRAGLRLRRTDSDRVRSWRWRSAR
jgi:pimeloyl-ACP methyl ester carboxylesterase